MRREKSDQESDRLNQESKSGIDANRCRFFSFVRYMQCMRYAVFMRDGANGQLHTIISVENTCDFFGEKCVEKLHIFNSELSPS
jgi:hypothetical protein